MLKALYKMLSGRLGEHSERLSAFYLCRQNKAAAPKALHGAAEISEKQAFFNSKLPQKNKILEILLTL